MALILASCTTPPNIAETKAPIGWHCEGEVGTESWKCIQRPMRNGRPAGDPIGGLQESSIEEQAPALASNPAPAMVRKRKQTSWRDQLPALEKKTESESIVKTETPETKPLVPIETRPELPPEPEAAFQTWADDTSTKAVVDRVEAPVAAAIIAEPTLEVETPSTSPELAATVNTVDLQTNLSASQDNNMHQSGYTVQLGAFSSEALAQEFIQVSNLEDIEVDVDSIEQSGEQLFLVTHGKFSTREAAQSDWERLGRAKGLEIWVRPVR